MKHCVIHRDCIQHESRMGGRISLTKLERARLAQSTINQLFKDAKRIVYDDGHTEERNVVKGVEIIVCDGDVERVIDFFKPGDQVRLYGAYLDMCLREAEGMLKRHGVIVEYDSNGCIY